VDAKNHIPSIPEVVKRKCCRNSSGAMGLVYSNPNGRQTYRNISLNELSMANHYFYLLFYKNSGKSLFSMKFLVPQPSSYVETPQNSNYGVKNPWFMDTLEPGRI